ADADPILRRALALDPQHYDALNNLGLVLDRLGRREEAEEMLRRAIEAAPGRGEAVTNLASLLRVAKRPADAEAVLRAALPGLERYPGVLRELGMAAEKQERYEEAIELYERAIALDPDDGDSRECLGSMLLSLARYEEAQAAYEAAIARKPEIPNPHFSRGCILLLQQDYPRGWPEYERRLEIEGMAAILAQAPGPRWTGDPLAGRRILLRGEQGAGDTILFARYVPEVAALGAEVVLEVQAPLKRLMSRLAGVREIVTPAEPVPPHDLQAMLGSLPLLLGRGAPTGAPYLSAEPERAAYWRERLGPRRKPRVGLVWAGNPKQASDPQRSIGLAPLTPLLDIEGVEFLSLQAGLRSADIAALGLGKRLRDISGELTDYAETAAALAEIDLLISSDTSAPHLAGALGRPCWALLSYSPDWRWQHGRSDSPWFSSLRLFRQPRLGDWASVVQEVAAALATADFTAKPR
ncbi:MAG TPA: tetratricopeptide repeat protein, partial [Stellaceae bacterium]|nr:tetratricopeptide repeat protein [Stellaceae bacterium]